MKTTDFFGLRRQSHLEGESDSTSPYDMGRVKGVIISPRFVPDQSGDGSR